MKSEALAIRTWDDLVFENRHKEYGAYPIRQAYSRHMIIAICITVALMLLLICISWSLPPSVALIIRPTCLGRERLKGPLVVCDLMPPLILEAGHLPTDKPSRLGSLPRVTHKDVAETQLAIKEIAALEESAEGDVTPIDKISPPKIDEILEVKSPNTTICTFPASPMPDYNGGTEAMTRFISKNLRYPNEARRKGIEGSVYISFVISVTGKVTEIKVIRSLSDECDQEAIRVVSLMPDWKPAMENNRMPVPVQMLLPIKFVITN